MLNAVIEFNLFFMHFAGILNAVMDQAILSLIYSLCILFGGMRDALRDLSSIILFFIHFGGMLNAVMDLS